MNIVCKDRRCLRCEHVYEVNIFGAGPDSIEMLTVAHYDGEPPPGTRALCPECSCAEYAPIASVATGVRLGDEGGVGRFYPYYDRGLGRHIRNDAHRNEVCRELGVVPLDGAEIDEEKYGNAYVEKLESSIKRWKDIEADYQRQEDTRVALAELEDKHKHRVKEALDGHTSTTSSTGYATNDVQASDGTVVGDRERPQLTRRRRRRRAGRGNGPQVR